MELLVSFLGAAAWAGFGAVGLEKFSRETDPSPEFGRYFVAVLTAIMFGPITWYLYERKMDKVLDIVDGFRYKPIVMKYHVSSELELPYTVKRRGEWELENGRFRSQ